MNPIRALAAKDAQSKLEPFEYTLGPLNEDQVDIEVQYCGICHSDLSMLKNEWGMTSYPFVPGHEVDFCTRHQIAPKIERFPMSKANEALEHLEKGKARYRIVLENDL